ncbi:ead/Ea22-like family protein [Citrobacter portucalensis]|uniref:ead/Ea22-like family protein n=1 Tax=Citrobacter portucalensis TaxID=1639133 RepID=UPI00202CB9A1|nr:ead/Ea22-like family protein [Citrobacter portucalensis]URR12035.1 ead/Ea22-like family protein [Citrobacter portucalensis]
MKALNKQAHQTENERMAQSLAERNGEPVEGLRQRISELEEIATDYGMKFQKAQDALKHQALLHKSQLEATENNLIDSECHVAELEEALRDKQALLEAAEKRIAELEARAVNLPKRSVGEVMHMSGFNRDYAEGWCAGNDNAIHEIRAAGIGVKGE